MSTETVPSPPPSDPLAAGKTFRRNFVLILLVITSGLFLAVAWPLLEALFLGALLTGLCQPLYKAILRRVRGHRAMAAGLTLLAVFFLIVGPLGLLLGLAVQQVMTVSELAIPWAQKLLESAGPSDVRLWLMDRLPWMQTLLPNEEEIARSAGEAAQSLGGSVLGGRDGRSLRHSGYRYAPGLGPCGRLSLSQRPIRHRHASSGVGSGSGGHRRQSPASTAGWA